MNLLSNRLILEERDSCKKGVMNFYDEIKIFKKKTTTNNDHNHNFVDFN